MKDPISNIFNLQHSCFINNDNFLFRYAQGQGQEYTMAFQVYYWREGMMAFREYRDSMGRNVSSSSTYYYFIIGFMIVFHQILHGNSDTFNVATNKLNPPLIASAIRIYPYSNHSRTVCLRLGLNGCVFEGDE